MADGAWRSGRSGRLQLVERFRAEVHLQQCFEPGPSEAQYRRALALRLTAGDEVVVHASRFAAEQLRAVASLLGARPGAAAAGGGPGVQLQQDGSPPLAVPARQVRAALAHVPRACVRPPGRISKATCCC